MKIIPETELQSLSKSLGSSIPTNEKSLDKEAIVNLETVFRKLIYTTSSVKLSLTHSAASWGCLSGFLEQGCTSSDPWLRKLCFCLETWVEVYDVFLARSQNNKSKPMKRMLLTLSKLLVQNPDKSARESLKEHVISTTTRLICDNGDFHSVKPAFLFLDHLLAKGIVPASSVIIKLSKGFFIQGKVCQYGSDIEKVESYNDLSLSRPEWIHMIETFVSCVLKWVQYPDISPVGGRLLASFFKSLQICDRESSLIRSLGKDPSLWVKPIMKALNFEPSLLEILESHVLPGLLRLDFDGEKPFLGKALWKDLKNENVKKYSVSEIQLYLLAVKIEIENNHARKARNNSLNAQRDIEKESQDIALVLLTHSAVSIRIAALSLIQKPTNFPEAFPPSVLDSLKRCLPYFHTEVNPKIRNEFIVIMRKFCARLSRSYLSFCQQNNLRQQSSAYDFTTRNQFTKVENNDDFPFIDYYAFSKWYIKFLISELRPTASYQRHITALKILASIVMDGTFKTNHDMLFDPANIVDEALVRDEQFLRLGCVRLILDLVMDPFDDVRHTATTLFELVLWNQQPSSIAFCYENIPTQSLNKNFAHVKTVSRQAYQPFLIHVLTRAEATMFHTGRADHADGVGRLYYLLYNTFMGSGKLILTESETGTSLFVVDQILSELEKNIGVANRDLRLAVQEAPLHGSFIALRHIICSSEFRGLVSNAQRGWSAWNCTIDRILACCGEVWKVVRRVLCFDSPEGYELEDDDDNDVSVETKDTLSFSWRALKESSSLMNVMITLESFTSHSSLAIRCGDIQEIGNLAFSQLAELRHRGAFSTVSQTFVACCKICVKAESWYPQQEDKSIQTLPQEWYQKALVLLGEKASALTRRSAGLPAIMTGILSALPYSDFCNNAIIDLQAIADAPIELGGDSENTLLPQVHSLNCLKDIFTDAQLGPSTEPHMADTLEIAASCFESEIWAIRNCGLMLFRALLSRLNGGSDTASTRVSSLHRRFSSLAYEKYQNLPGLILRLLSQASIQRPDNLLNSNYSEACLKHAQRVFPVLEIVERFGLPFEYREEIQYLIWQQMEGPIWALREKAAKTLSLVIGGENFISELFNLLKDSRKSQNNLHGRLMCARFIVSHMDNESKGGLKSILPLCVDLFDSLVIENCCSFTAATYVEFIADIVESLIQRQTFFENDSSKEIQKWIMNLKEKSRRSALQENLNAKPTSCLFERALGRCRGLLDQAEALLIFPSMERRLNGCEDVDKTKPLCRTSSEQSIKSLFEDSLHNCLNQAENSGSSLLKVSSTLLFEKDKQTKLNNVQSGIQRSNLGPTFLSEGSAILDDRYDRSFRKSPQKSNDDLRAAGTILGLSYSTQDGTLKDQSAVLSWICLLSLAVDGNSELSTRFAAIDSIAGFITSFRKRDFSGYELQTNNTFIGLYVAVYDALLDDDEDVREKAAMITSCITDKEVFDPVFTLSPPAAVSRLLQFLTPKLKNSRVLFVEAVYRLTGMRSLFKLGPAKVALIFEGHILDGSLISESPPTARKPSLHLFSFVGILQQAKNQDDVLFAEEKQNLFIDPVREAERWAEVLFRSPLSQWTANLVRELGDWTLEGLKELIEATRAKEDGPLGWTSKPDVFALGMRLILAAKIHIHWSKTNNNTVVPEIKTLLKELLDQGKIHNIHGLWLDSMEEILEIKY